MTTRRTGRLAMLAGLLTAGLLAMPGDARVNAQGRSGEELIVKLAGKKIRVDKATGKLRSLSRDEARELVTTLTAMTDRTEVARVTAPSGTTTVRLAGFDHVLVGRPAEDGTVDVRCVASADEAAEFLAQEVSPTGKE